MRAEYIYERYFSRIDSELPILKLLSSSELARTRHQQIYDLITSDDCLKRLQFKDYIRILQRTSLNSSVEQFKKVLRTIRIQHLFRLLLRELADISTTEHTTADWSDFADAVILYTIQYCLHQLQQKYGLTQYDLNDLPLHVIAVGKLGGQELNFSSDIDIVFAFEQAGHTAGEQSITHQELYTKVIQQFIQILQPPTSLGHVFRVDLRLRPFGSSGPLAMSYPALETYYQEEGRDWERFAMVKARLINRSKVQHQKMIEQIIIPFVYRRYVDFSVIESLRGMKVMIEREIKQNPMLNDIKRGQGGIRELEFIIQSVQLIRGGRISKLRCTSAMGALDRIGEAQLISETDELKQAYWFLRQLENTIQTYHDQQSHRVPDSREIQEQLALSMNFRSWDEVQSRLKKTQETIHRLFTKVLGQSDSYIDEKRLYANQLNNIWQGHVESTMAINYFIHLNYHNPEKCYQLIQSFRQSPKCRRLTQTAQMRLNRFMILLLKELEDIENTDEVLLQVIHLLDQIVGRSIYLALLSENPQVLKEVLYWFEHSAFITKLIVKQPFLLEVLIDQSKDWLPPDKTQLAELLDKKLENVTDEEMLNEALRQFKLSNWLLAARAEHFQLSPVHDISRFLAEIAEVIIQRVLLLSAKHLKHKYPEIHHVLSHFAIVAYGKFGACEMSYSSDLDLVFLHTVSEEQVPIINRLSQKVIHSLTLCLQSGVLYDVDTRLRPSGASGLLVSHLDAFIQYQQKQAWTWEHQALVRARVVFGEAEFLENFLRLKENVLFSKRSSTQLKADVLNMKNRMSSEVKNVDMKYAPGGLIDLEFLVQYLVLSNPHKNLVRLTNTLDLMFQLFKNKTIAKKEFVLLKNAYLNYHQALHQLILKSESVELSESLNQVQKIMALFYDQ